MSHWWNFHNSRRVATMRLAARLNREKDRKSKPVEDIYLTGEDLNRWYAGDEAFKDEVRQVAGSMLNEGTREVCIRRPGGISPLESITSKEEADPR